MTTTFRETDHPRGAHGKFAPKEHAEATVALQTHHDPTTEAKVQLSRAVTGTDTARVQTLAEFDGSTRVMVANREVLSVRHVADLARSLSDFTAATRRARGEDVAYRADDGISGDELDGTLGVRGGGETVIDAAVAEHEDIRDAYTEAMDTLHARLVERKTMGGFGMWQAVPTAERIEDAVSTSYAEAQRDFRPDRDPDRERAERWLRGDAAALAQVYTRGSTDEDQALEIFTDALRTGQDFATAKARIIAEAGEHKSGSSAFQALTASQRAVFRGQL
ncbi:hypothetical protein GCM10011374_36330 [Kocuria dechangensis]|uniref:Uncharacterized protein n=1 Tax=Kocuria dechangensis TaxID=1176249 RepID=A0A917LZV8_9MICC|nr:hypothetical protein [Kocuria dechangensis]GGG68663.1 hypothetical protein GCM10011374_36330 [Kocuria dechangensis]